MQKNFYYTIFLAIVTIGAYGLQLSSDSADIVKPRQRTSPTLNTRVHTMGLFMYMGKVVNHNPAADIFFTYLTRSGWGVSAFKVVDLNDINSHNNFAFAFLHKSFHLGKRITVSPYAGIALEQQHSFASHGSDIMVQLNSNFRLNKNFTVEHIAMFNNVAIETDYADWTNRVRVLYSNGHVDLSGFFWHNNGLLDNGNYTSSGISVFYNRVPLSKRLFLGAGLTTLSTVQSSNREKIPTQTGLQFSTILTFK